jgi:protease-4
MNRLVLFGLLCLAGGTTLAEDTTRLVVPDDVFYDRPAATVFGSEASWINPAGLGKFGAAGFQIMADYDNGDYAKSYGAIVYRDRITSGFRHIENPNGTDLEEWLMATGLQVGPSISVGLSYRYFNKGTPDYKNRHQWTLGLMSRSTGPFALAAVWSNLNRGRFQGERTSVEQRYSVGYRPFRNQLTLAVDMLTTAEYGFDDANYVYHAEYIPLTGLYLTGSFDSDRNFQVGVRANLLKYFVGSQSSFDRHGHGGRTTAFFGATNTRQPSLISTPRRNLRVSVTGGLSENPPQPVFGRKGTPFLTLILQIYRAAEDPSIQALHLELDRLALGFGQAQELREALAYFRTRGKSIVCHVSSPNNLGYYVATVADKILIPPVSQLRLVGLRAELTFWAGALNKLGVDVELLRVGDYKTAPEQYTREVASDQNREQVNRILDDLYDQFVTGIADGRNMSVRQVRELIDRGPFSSQEALEAGLVDGLSYRDAVGSEYMPSLPTITFRRYLADTLMQDDWEDRPVIAVVVAEGEIAGDGGDDNPFDSGGKVTPSVMAAAYQKAAETRNVRGVVLRINSPGGWALAGEEIFHSGDKAAERRPMAVSMSNVAASGGYQIAMPARILFVDPATVTGSIGIYGGKLNLGGLYEKLNVGKELYTRGRFAGMLTNMRPFTDEEAAKYQSHLDAFYEYFVDLVAANRGLPVDSVHRLGQGQVWTGREAVANGLADRAGGIKQTLDYLAAEAGLDEYTVEIFPQKRPWIILPGGSLWSRLAGLVTGNETSPDAALDNLPLSEEASIMARLPFELQIE